MAHFRKIVAGLVKDEFTEYIGEIGNVFFNIETGELRLSDGVTPGGIPIAINISGSLVGGAGMDITGNELSVAVDGNTTEIVNDTVVVAPDYQQKLETLIWMGV